MKDKGILKSWVEGVRGSKSLAYCPGERISLWSKPNLTSTKSECLGKACKKQKKVAALVACWASGGWQMMVISRSHMGWVKLRKVTSTSRSVGKCHNFSESVPSLVKQNVIYLTELLCYWRRYLCNKWNMLSGSYLLSSYC